MGTFSLGGQIKVLAKVKRIHSDLLSILEVFYYIVEGDYNWKNTKDLLKLSNLQKKWCLLVKSNLKIT